MGDLPARYHYQRAGLTTMGGEGGEGAGGVGEIVLPDITILEPCFEIFGDPPMTRRIQMLCFSVTQSQSCHHHHHFDPIPLRLANVILEHSLPTYATLFILSYDNIYFSPLKFIILQKKSLI